MPEILGQIVLGGSLALAAALQPGPLQAFLVSRVLASGWRRTLPACFAPIVSDGPIAILATVVLGRLSTEARHVLQASGGVLLLCLAVDACRRWRQPARPASAAVPRTVGAAVLVNLLNPNPYLGWTLVLGPAVVTAWRHRPVEAVAFVSAFYATMLATLCGFVCLAGTARLLGERAQRALVGVSALLLAGLGVLLLVLALR